jgi:hypothetical protein
MEGCESMSQMTKKEAVDLMAYFTLVAVSKMGNQLLEKYVSVEQTDKMMRVVVSLFAEDSLVSEAFIIGQLQRLLRKLDVHEVPESQIKYFKKGDSEE